MKEDSAAQKQSPVRQESPNHKSRNQYAVRCSFPVLQHGEAIHIHLRAIPVFRERVTCAATLAAGSQHH